MRRLLVVVLLSAAAGCAREAPGGPVGEWTLRVGDELAGSLRLGPSGCRVALWGETFTTGDEPVPCEASGAQVRFGLRFGAGSGRVGLDLDPRAGTADLPLGARPGEHVLHHRLEPGLPPPREAAARAHRAAASVDRWRTAWEAGRFLLLPPGDGDPAGRLDLYDDGSAVVDLFEPFWITRGPQEALRRDEGPDLVLVFPAEPALEGEPGVLRVNQPLAVAVIPSGPAPDPADRRLRLAPGSLPDARAEALRRRAVEARGASERSVILPRLVELARSLRPEDGCRLPPGGGWREVLTGYRVTARPGTRGCRVALRPDPVQHGRRLRAEVGPGGPVDAELLPLPGEDEAR